MELVPGRTYTLSLVSQEDESLSPYSYHGMPGATPPYSPGGPIPDWYPVPLLSDAFATCLRAKYQAHKLEAFISPPEVPGDLRLYATVVIYVRSGSVDSEQLLADAKQCLDNLYRDYTDDWGVRWGEIICPWVPLGGEEHIQVDDGDKLSSPLVHAAQWGGVAGAFLIGLRVFGIWGGLAAAALGALLIRPPEVDRFLGQFERDKDSFGAAALGLGAVGGIWLGTKLKEDGD